MPLVGFFMEGEKEAIFLFIFGVVLLLRLTSPRYIKSILVLYKFLETW